MKSRDPFPEHWGTTMGISKGGFVFAETDKQYTEVMVWLVNQAGPPPLPIVNNEEK